jgi:LacI family transcriptional regulator
MTEQIARPTIHEVSRVAGVSISSVSRALNGQTRNADLIRRVTEAVATVGYVPSAIAQSLRSQRVGQVALAVEDIGNPAYLAMVRAIQPVLRAADIRLVLHSTDGIVREEIEIVRSLGNRYVDGLIICPIRPNDELLAAIGEASAPIVLIGSMPSPVTVDNIHSESRQGAMLALEHLIAKGCRRIGLINGPADTVPGGPRQQAYLDVLGKYDLLDSQSIENADGFSFEDGFAAGKRLIARGELDAVLGTTDRLALGGLHALRDGGFSAPDDVRVVGIDDSEVAATSLPTLTSVNLGAVELGRRAAEMIVSRLLDETLAPRSVSIAPTLTERESSR